MSRLLLLSLLLICSTLLACSDALKYGARGNKRKEISAARTTKKDICRAVCNNYRGICMHEWLDPTNVYSPHCTGEIEEVPPNSACINCLKSTGLTSSTKPTTTSRQPTTTSQSPATEPTFPTEPPVTTDNEPITSPSTEVDKCRIVCGGYAGICLPEWLDVEDWFTPHCDDVGEVGKPNATCLSCLLVNGIPDRDWMENRCQQECFCHREITVKLESPSRSCATNGFCGGKNKSAPPPLRSVSDVSHCDCVMPEGCSDAETTNDAFCTDLSTDFTTLPVTIYPTPKYTKRSTTTERELNYDEMML